MHNEPHLVRDRRDETHRLLVGQLVVHTLVECEDGVDHVHTLLYEIGLGLVDLERHELQGKVGIRDADGLLPLVSGLCTCVEVLDHGQPGDMVVHSIVIVAEEQCQQFPRRMRLHLVLEEFGEVFARRAALDHPPVGVFGKPQSLRVGIRASEDHVG